MRQGFDNAKYIELQAAHIKERISQFGGKLYLEFGGKLFDDYHASRVLPGFEPDSKFRMLKSIADDVEVIIAINANHIEKNKARGDLGITYDEDVLRLVDLFRGNGFAVAAVVITQYAGQPAGRCSGSGKSVPDLPPELPQGEQAKQIGEVGQSHAQQGQKPRQKPVCQKLCPIDSYRPMISGSSSTILARAGSK